MGDDHRRRSKDSKKEHHNDRRSSAKHHERHSEDRRRSSDSKRKHSRNDDEKNEVKAHHTGGLHDDIFRRLSAIATYDADYRRNSEKEERKKSNAKRKSEDRRSSQKERRDSKEKDRKNSRDDKNPHRHSIPPELQKLDEHLNKNQKDDQDHSHYHQRWMFLWPFGKKDKGDADKKGKTEEACKLVYETEAVQTIDDALKAPSTMLTKNKVKMKTEDIQTSFASFRMQSKLPEERIAIRSGVPVSLRDGNAQTIETKIKQGIHEIQTSFANFRDNFKKRMQDSTTSMAFENGHLKIPPKMGRNIKAIPRERQEEPRAENNAAEDAESQVSPGSSIYSNNPVKSKPTPTKEKESNICPICKRGRYVTQMSFTGCLAAFLCFLCCGPCWCRRCCDITVCNYCGCSKGFYKHGKDGKEPK